MAFDKRTRRGLARVLLLALLLTGAPTAPAQSTEAAPNIQAVMDGIVAWKKADMGLDTGEALLSGAFLAHAGQTAGDWYPIAIGRLGLEDDYLAYLAVVTDGITEWYGASGGLDPSKSTEWHRITLAILSMGGDPTGVGTADGAIDLVADGVYNPVHAGLGAQGINGWIWGLITLDSLRYQVPAGAVNTRDGIIAEILSLQLPDGGFALQSGEADPDITAMAVQALAPYYNSEQTYTCDRRYLDGQTETRTVRSAVDEALSALSDLQLYTGDYESWGAQNAESTAQVIMALCALGIDPLSDERFIKNGNTLLDGLMRYRMDDGGFIHAHDYDGQNPSASPDQSNTMAGEQVLCALAALTRLQNGLRSLYDFRPEPEAPVQAAVQSARTAIRALSDTPDPDELEAAWALYLQVPPEERSYVYEYARLADAREAAGLDNNAEHLSAHMGQNTSGTGAVTRAATGEAVAVDDTLTRADLEAAEALAGRAVKAGDYVEATVLLYKLRRDGSGRHDGLIPALEAKRGEIGEILDRIEEINGAILDRLYPFSDIGMGDRAQVEEIVAMFTALDPEDQRLVDDYEDVLRAQAQIEGQFRAMYTGIALGVIALLLTGFIAVRMRRRRRAKRERMMELLADEGGDE